MLHLGDITKISGYDAPVVDCIIGGSPCQDLSVAGKRAGLAGERSGLFMEQIRIVKEMRARGGTNDAVRPRYMVWENVPGAFSSNGGKDFAAVLEEAIRVAEPEAPDVDVPEKGWPTSGCYFDEMGRWSVAWRVLDAQFWGVPQRRRRIALVADFGGLSASEILFVRKGVSGYSEPGKPKRKATARTSGEGTAEPVPCTLKIRGGCSGGGKGALVQEDKSATLSTLQDQTLFQPIGFAYKAGAKAGSVAAVYDARGNGDGLIAPTMTGDHQNRVTDYTSILPDDQGGSQMSVREDGKSPTLRAEMHGNIPCVLEETTCTDIGFFNSLQERRTTLLARGYKDPHLVHEPNHIVRRLTPMECERLQGFPDGWTDIEAWVDSKGKLHKPADSPRYKALGNSIAIPPWKWLLKRLCACYERDATMASLFDGIGGFPLIWEQINGKGSCLWASEIEEFPMAVTKVRFGE